MKVFYIGSAGPLSLQPFHYLLSTGHEICGVGLDRQQASGSPLPWMPLAIHELDALDSLAKVDNIPVIDLKQATAGVALAVSELQPDLILVSCYARKLDGELLDLAELGAFNIHPSLLPAFRGPAPLFWQFREGIEHFGLSLHRMTSRFDAGPVICSQQTSMPDGINLPAATSQLAGRAEALLNDGLMAIGQGYDGAEQNEVDASYQTYPEPVDFTVSVEWSAKRIFNFMRATAHMGQPYACRVEGQDMRLKHALACSSEGKPDFASGQGQAIEIACARGTLVVSYYQ